ncbi:phosphoenolpyruvate--protein phosphotransferase [Colwellia sp. RSH04]|uniref:phosphoenolpyruvate--protein phosphotransferase n=1 Tax=Colwellia sp. RSH04 TaxID=2305464 RepID=UPI000E56F669|nr:phosphoenolpyruvate--protein phosphotransferase [Colwellia sp. RSH04]RHW75373.1 phosphoenolpyruvate-protein phosphotransferase PtsP [Colwellia sp. RSH04]
MLATLRRIVLDFSQETELQSALERMVTQVKSAMNTECCSIYLADYHYQHFVLMASDGLAINSLGKTCIGFSEGLVGLVGQREEPLNIANAQAHKDYIHAPEVQEDDLKAFLGTPIIHQRKVLGILTIQQTQARYFSENEEAFLVTLSAQLAGALASAETKNLIFNPQAQVHQNKQLQGIAGSAGIAMSQIVVCQPQADLSSVSLKKVTNIAGQHKRIAQAIEKTRTDFEQLSNKLTSIVKDESLAIFDVYKQMLAQAGIGQEITDKINLGWRADSALKMVIEHYVAQFKAIEDTYLQERASDVQDLGNRLLFNLRKEEQQTKALPNEFILLAKDVTASMLAEYQHKGLKGIISLSGSNNSHAAILARSLGLPAIMGVNAVAFIQLDLQQAIVDGYSGELFINPDETLVQEYQYLISQEQELTEKVMEVAHLPCITKDGRAIEILLNAGLSEGFEHSGNLGALSIGLYRTEIPFMNRSCFPSEQEQTLLYKRVLSAFPKHAVTMRTLDVGGDKSLPYFPIVEENPFLGWRGIRITLDHPEIFLVQIRAMLRANQGIGNLEIMLPMISNIEEVDEAIRLINQAYFELKAEIKAQLIEELTKTPDDSERGSQIERKAEVISQQLMKPRVGIMLEIPSVIFQLPELAKRVDFFSVGSNDLTQYLLAVDRNNSQVANLYDSFHPAVLRALYAISQESAQLLVPISLCGELASTPAGAILLLAMGFDKLSMNSHNVPRIKWVIRHVSFEQAQEILSHTLTLPTTNKVHDYLNEQLETLGLGGFIRAGY